MRSRKQSQTSKNDKEKGKQGKDLQNKLANENSQKS
jgi:hypothetical protein